MAFFGLCLVVERLFAMDAVVVTLNVAPARTCKKIARVRRAGRSGGKRYANAVVSPANRPMVNTAIAIGKGRNKAVASLSNGFILSSIRRNTAIYVDCVNFRPIRVM